MTTYVISSKKYRSINKALQQIERWLEEGKLDGNARIYQVSKSWGLKV